MAQYDPNWTRAHYDAYGMREWDRWDESPVERVKFSIHRHYIQSNLRPGDRVLEIGAGAGRFTCEIAQVTDRIVVADLSPGQLKLNRENAARLDFASSIEAWIECDVCDLQPHFDKASFDVVVCTGGPLSYVFDRRGDAVAELLHVTRPGGLLVASVMSLWGAIHQYLRGVLEIDPEANRAILSSGDLTPKTIGPARHYTHMFRSSEFRRLLEQGGWCVESMSASSCLSVGWAEYLEGLAETDPIWGHLIEMELEASHEAGCLDMGTHLIAICRRPSSPTDATATR